MPRAKKSTTSGSNSIKAVYDWARFERPEVLKDLSAAQTVALHDALDTADHNHLQLWYEASPDAAMDAWGTITGGTIAFPYEVQRARAA